MVVAHLVIGWLTHMNRDGGRVIVNRGWGFGVGTYHQSGGYCVVGWGCPSKPRKSGSSLIATICCRRMFARFDKYAARSLAFIHLSSACIWLKYSRQQHLGAYWQGRQAARRTLHHRAAAQTGQYPQTVLARAERARSTANSSAVPRRLIAACVACGLLTPVVTQETGRSEGNSRPASSMAYDLASGAPPVAARCAGASVTITSRSDSIGV